MKFDVRCSKFEVVLIRKVIYMATITKFEDLEIWQLARLQTNDFDKLIETTSLARDFELRNQMNASSGSVMDCIAEGFERSGSISFRKYSMNYIQKMVCLEIS